MIDEILNNYALSRSKEVVIRKIKFYNVGFVFANKYIQELGYKLLELDSELDAIAIINCDDITYISTKEDIDLNEITEQFGKTHKSKIITGKIESTNIDRYLKTLIK